MNCREVLEAAGGPADGAEDLAESGAAEGVGESVRMPAPGAGHGVVEFVDATIVAALARDKYVTLVA